MKKKSLARLQKHLAKIAYHPAQDASVVAVKSGNKSIVSLIYVFVCQFHVFTKTI